MSHWMLYSCVIFITLIYRVSCIVGATSVDTHSKHELFPYLLFGFKNGGRMIETLTYSANSSDITLQPNNIMQSCFCCCW